MTTDEPKAKPTASTEPSCDEGSGAPSSGPRQSPDSERQFELGDLFRRLVEAGAKSQSVRQKAPEVLRQLASELKVPKDVLINTLSHLDETKQGVYRAVGREVRELLSRTSISEELARAASLLALEIKMEVRFKPSDSSSSSRRSRPTNESASDTAEHDASKTEEAG